MSSESFLLIDKNDDKKGLSVFTAVMFIVGALAGSGVLALPQALANTGWSGIVILILSGLLAIYSGLCLGHSWVIIETLWPQYRVPVRKPFSIIGERAFGKWSGRLCSLLLDINSFGSAVVYLILSSDIILSIIDNNSNISPTNCQMILIIALILCPFTWFGSPIDFWPLATCATLTTMIGLILLLINMYNDIEKQIPIYGTQTIKGVFLGFGIILYAFGGSQNFPTFQNDMKDKTLFSNAVIIGFMILIIIYFPISIMGYIVYGSAVNTDILVSLSDGPLKTTISLLFSIHLILAILIVINPFSLDIESTLNIPERFTYKRCITRSLIMTGLTFIALSVPHFGKVMALIGGSTISLSSFVFPPIFYLSLISKYCKQFPERKVYLSEKSLTYVAVSLGVIAGLASTYSAVYDLIGSIIVEKSCFMNI